MGVWLFRGPRNNSLPHLLAEHIPVMLESRYGYSQVVEYLIVSASSGPYGIRPPLLRFLYWGWRALRIAAHRTS